MPLDYFDYTLLQKRGLLKKEPEIKSDVKINSQGFVDFTQSTNNVQDTTPPQPAQSDGNMFGFLDSMASVGASNPSSTPSASVYGGSSGTSNAESEIATLKVKLDDTQYKLDRLIEKIAKIEEKLGGF